MIVYIVFDDGGYGEILAVTSTREMAEEAAKSSTRATMIVAYEVDKGYVSGDR